MSGEPRAAWRAARIFAFLIKAAADEAPAGRPRSWPGILSVGPPSGLLRAGVEMERRPGQIKAAPPAVEARAPAE